MNKKQVNMFTLSYVYDLIKATIRQSTPTYEQNTSQFDHLKIGTN